MSNLILSARMALYDRPGDADRAITAGLYLLDGLDLGDRPDFLAHYTLRMSGGLRVRWYQIGADLLDDRQQVPMSTSERRVLALAASLVTGSLVRLADALQVDETHRARLVTAVSYAAGRPVVMPPVAADLREGDRIVIDAGTQTVAGIALLEYGLMHVQTVERAEPWVMRVDEPVTITPAVTA